MMVTGFLEVGDWSHCLLKLNVSAQINQDNVAHLDHFHPFCHWSSCNWKINLALSASSIRFGCFSAFFVLLVQMICRGVVLGHTCLPLFNEAVLLFTQLLMALCCLWVEELWRTDTMDRHDGNMTHRKHNFLLSSNIVLIVLFLNRTVANCFFFD